MSDQLGASAPPHTPVSIENLNPNGSASHTYRGLSKPPDSAFGRRMKALRRAPWQVLYPDDEPVYDPDPGPDTSEAA
jgi:hypothetical protein